MRFTYRPIDKWAPLAWAAICSERSADIEVLHGRLVETREKWFCEAAWPGPFDSGDFDRTDLLVGTGGRLREGAALFVSAGNTVDRIVSIKVGDRFFVSNSLACLTALTGSRADPIYPHYYEDFCSIVAGIRKYKRTIPSNLGDIRSDLFGCIAWDGQTARHRHHDPVRRDFSTFERYNQFLLSSLQDLVNNIKAPRRATLYKLLSTTSSGYDSVAVSSIAKAAGCEETICIENDRFGDSEDGAAVANHLRLTPITIQRSRWKDLGRDTFFVACDGTSEAVALSSAEPHLCNRVLLTGYHGDKVWDKETKDLSEDIVRGDSSGLSMSEYRLWVGFLHLPLPFWGVRQIRDINALSNAEEMKPWDIGGDYSRPIPRRIAELAGVPRSAFGQAKRATAVNFSEFLSPRSMRSYQEWLARNRWAWLRRGRFPPPVSLSYDRFEMHAVAAAESVMRRLPYLWKFTRGGLDRPTRLRRHAFPWALETIAERYRGCYIRSS